ncbi:hypothetical protein GmRootV118_39870 [Variovorax sp. V118]|uniref:DUF262 domain-containing protein n=1 Tax=Variovorax sp. V118 TaxID=3065954 RepID=UPI0034E887AC
MIDADNYLHTTHRTISWFQKAAQREELELAAPFQRNPVWTDKQKSFLMDSILQGYPIPELYMSDSVDSVGDEVHTVIDGQQRIRACLDYLAGGYRLLGEDIQGQWKGKKFDQLSVEEKKIIFSYKFVVRILPAMNDADLRRIFSRLNRNVVALNEQELRNATYWGGFISTVQEMADADEFWSEFGIFTAKDHRRMIDHEFIGELVAAYLHGPQNKKDKLDSYYRDYEEDFEQRDEVMRVFRATTGEIRSLIPADQASRFRKKSDFYSLFLALVPYAREFPWPSDRREAAAKALAKFGHEVTTLLAIEEADWKSQNKNAIKYARAVSRAATDKQNRIARQEALTEFLELTPLENQ